MIHQPVHASWLNQIEIYFSAGQRKLLTHNDFPDLDTLADRLEAFEARYNKAAKSTLFVNTVDNAAEGACTEVPHRITAHSDAPGRHQPPVCVNFKRSGEFMDPAFDLPVGQDVKSSGSYTALTPLAFLERSLDVFADKTAIAYGDRRLTYSEFGAAATRLANALRASGVERGDRVAYLCPNIPEMLVTNFGVPLAGAVMVPINTRLSAEEVRYICEVGRTLR